VTAYAVFNGDADGLCALRQLRPNEPRQAVLITGVRAARLPHPGGLAADTAGVTWL
jgi:hypothetical protein